MGSDMAEAKANLGFVRVTPRKARVVIDMIRGQQVPMALAMLRHTPKHAARVIEKLLRSAVANAEQKEMGDSDEMWVSQGRCELRAYLQAFPGEIDGSGEFDSKANQPYHHCSCRSERSAMRRTANNVFTH